MTGSPESFKKKSSYIRVIEEDDQVSQMLPKPSGKLRVRIKSRKQTNGSSLEEIMPFQRKDSKKISNHKNQSRVAIDRIKEIYAMKSQNKIPTVTLSSLSQVNSLFNLR